MSKYLAKIKKYHFITFIILTFIYLGNVMCITLNHASKKLTEEHFNQFTGSAACVSCHKEIYQQHIHTAHYFTSRPAEKKYIKGSFEQGRNHYTYNKWMEVVIENTNDSFYQTSYISGQAFESKPFDIVIGSGRKGQTYLYWDSLYLYQLPVSYYTPSNSWCNSPGYPANFINFGRQIPGQCIECHGTYASVTEAPGRGTIFDKNRILYGVDCERCHGPAAEHVAFHAANPTEKTAKYIINPSGLTRQQRIDACALCHSGIRKEIKPPFSFTAGQKLDDYSVANYNADSVSALDVHGNQYGLLTSSNCFRHSLTMDCSSCHNVHVNEVNSPKIFSQRCMACHNETSHNTCTLPTQKGLVLSDNCIDCHMPLLASKKIILKLSEKEKSQPDFVRTHLISIYPNKTKEFLQKMKSTELK